MDCLHGKYSNMTWMFVVHCNVTGRLCKSQILSGSHLETIMYNKTNVYINVYIYVILQYSQICVSFLHYDKLCTIWCDVLR